MKMKENRKEENKLSSKNKDIWFVKVMMVRVVGTEHNILPHSHFFLAFTILKGMGVKVLFVEVNSVFGGNDRYRVCPV